MKEEIKIYHSVWKNVLLILCCLVFVAVSIQILLDEDEERLRFIVAVWIGIPFSGLGGLLIAYNVLKEQLLQIPYLIITDKKVTMTGRRPWEASFADVDSFFLTCISISWMIGIKYKEDIEHQRLDNASQLGRTIRNINVKVAGAQETIAADGLKIKPQALCDLLNERLEEFNRNK